MFKAIKEFLFGKTPEVQQEAPYKVEAPVFQPVVDVPPVKTEEAAPAKKKPVAKKRQFDKKPKVTGDKPKAPKKKKEA